MSDIIKEISQICNAQSLYKFKSKLGSYALLTKHTCICTLLHLPFCKNPMVQHSKSHKRQVDVGGVEGGGTTALSKVIGPKENEKDSEIYF